MLPIQSKVFQNGNSQAVRIPKELRLNAGRVEIIRNDKGELIIIPINEAKGSALLKALSNFDEEFVNCLEQVQQEQEIPQDREDL